MKAQWEITIEAGIQFTLIISIKELITLTLTIKCTRL
jgi:hypothetical protein